MRGDDAEARGERGEIARGVLERLAKVGLEALLRDGSRAALGGTARDRRRLVARPRFRGSSSARKWRGGVDAGRTDPSWTRRCVRAPRRRRRGGSRGVSIPSGATWPADGRTTRRRSSSRASRERARREVRRRVSGRRRNPTRWNPTSASDGLESARDARRGSVDARRRRRSSSDRKRGTGQNLLAHERRAST